jgi:hypothetical protein
MHHLNHHKDKKEKEEAENADLLFCFEAIVILEEALSKLNYIGNYTYSNSANVMSNSIGQQIENKMKLQRELEKTFEGLIQDKSSKTELLEEKKINELVGQIQKCAIDLKKSTNDICKSLSENPDIPVNLKKSKEDKNVIISKINDVKGDLVNGSFEKFGLILSEIEKNSIKIDDKRAREMYLFEELRKLNDVLAKEESDYIKDTKNLENRLISEKKKLAKTKMEESIFKDYRANQVEALKTLKKTNFKDDQLNMDRKIIEKNKEKVNKLNLYRITSLIWIIKLRNF